MAFISILKDTLLPSSADFRRFPFGIGSGIVMSLDFTHQTRLFLGLYEIEIAGHCKRLLRQSRSAFDIGANAGYYSLILAKHTGGQVVAVEPVDENISKMQANFARNPYPITAVQALVGAKSEGDTVSLDQLSADYFRPDFIKMDIEGGEVDALQGGLRLLEEHRPHLVIEVHGEQLEAGCREILTRFDYRITRVAPRTWLPETRVDAYNGWIICEGSPRPRSPSGAEP
ncbi:MAG: FkbM family methyltransferase [Rhodospirillales bacterium]|nr:FkbM family methyltransferase [Rhodospirillales bacterium]